jgi:hypothetical protein
LENETDFACVVFENGTKGDTLVVDIEPFQVYEKTHSNL